MKGYKIYKHNEFKGIIKGEPTEKIRAMFNVSGEYTINQYEDTFMAESIEGYYPICEYKAFDLI